MNLTELVKEQEYKIKVNFKARAVRGVYTGIYTDGGETAYKFDTKSGTLFLLPVHIEAIEVAAPKKAKKKTPKTCTRCLGNGIYQHLAHINGGRCYKCNGSGVI